MLLKERIKVLEIDVERNSSHLRLVQVVQIKGKFNMMMRVKHYWCQGGRPG